MKTTRSRCFFINLERDYLFFPQLRYDESEIADAKVTCGGQVCVRVGRVATPRDLRATLWNDKTESGRDR